MSDPKRDEPDRKPAAAGSDGWDRPWPRGWEVEHVVETGSTNADLLDPTRLRPHRSVLVADHQTEGRGRLDRRWHAPPGANLLVSVLFKWHDDDVAQQIRSVGLAALEACRIVAPEAGEYALKWPNDLLLDGAKLAGVLGQSDVARRLAVVGVGINVGWAPPGAARLGDGVDRADLLEAMLVMLDRMPAPGPALHVAYCARLATIGQQVRVELPDGDVVGRALDVDPDGRLVVLDASGTTHRFHAGDVTHLRSVG